MVVLIGLVSAGSRSKERHFFDKLLAREDAVRKGEDSEDVHQMHVATRRLRASLQVVEGVYHPKLIRRYRRGLQQIALQENLGALQDGVTARMHIAALGLADDPGAQAYLTARTTEHDSDLAKLPRLWEKVASATYRQRLFEMIVKL